MLSACSRAMHGVFGGKDKAVSASKSAHITNKSTSSPYVTQNTQVDTIDKELESDLTKAKQIYAQFVANQGESLHPDIIALQESDIRELNKKNVSEVNKKIFKAMCDVICFNTAEHRWLTATDINDDSTKLISLNGLEWTIKEANKVKSAIYQNQNDPLIIENTHGTINYSYESTVGMAGLRKEQAIKQIAAIPQNAQVDAIDKELDSDLTKAKQIYAQFVANQGESLHPDVLALQESDIRELNKKNVSEVNKKIFKAMCDVICFNTAEHRWLTATDINDDSTKLTSLTGLEWTIKEANKVKATIYQNQNHPLIRQNAHGTINYSYESTVGMAGLRKEQAIKQTAHITQVQKNINQYEGVESIQSEREKIIKDAIQLADAHLIKKSYLIVNELIEFAMQEYQEIAESNLSHDNVENLLTGLKWIMTEASDVKLMIEKGDTERELIKERSSVLINYSVGITEIIDSLMP